MQKNYNYKIYYASGINPLRRVGKAHTHQAKEKLGPLSPARSVGERVGRGG
jgi:hypothetical protein